MGLDVHLYHYDNHRSTLKLEKEYTERSDKNWESLGKDYNDMTSDDKKAIQAKNVAVAEALGLDGDGCDSKRKTSIEENSKLYPDHMFKIGYFRSSYNEGGINSILRNITGKDLYYIFEPKEENYEVTVDWESALERAKKAVFELRKHVKTNGAFRVIEIYDYFGNKTESPKNSKEALELLYKENSQKAAFGSYSNSNGHFFLKEPLEVVGIIGGQKAGFDGQPRSCTYVIYRDSDGFDWYEKALEIVVETIEYVLAQPDPEKYLLHWSA